VSRRLIVAALLVLITGLVLDARRAPAQQFLVAATVGSIHLYQRTVSPLVARAGFQCRFKPTCSHYGELALEKYGFARGAWMTAWRVARCRPGGAAPGTVDMP
jgi:putative membrane protein insertion efficiency factor